MPSRQVQETPTRRQDDHMTVSSPRWSPHPGNTTPPYWIRTQEVSDKQFDDLFTSQCITYYEPGYTNFASLIHLGCHFMEFYSVMQWNLYDEARKGIRKTRKFHHLPGMVFTKSCLVSLSWKTTSLERPQNWRIALYRLYCIKFSMML